MGSKNLRSSGSSASGHNGGLKAWLHRDKGTEIGTDGCAEKKVHLFRRKRAYSVSRSPDFNWEITRYDRQPGYESVRSEFEKRRTAEVVIPKAEAPVHKENVMRDVPVKNGTRSTVPTLDAYFKEESTKAEIKAAEHIEVKPEIKTYRQESLFDRKPKMVEAEEETSFFEGPSFFTGLAGAAEAATCSSASEVPVQTFTFEEEPSEINIDVITEIASNEECCTSIEISEEDMLIAELCEELATFTVMNDILPEIMAEEESVIESVPAEDPEDAFIADLCEDIVAKFIVDELMPGLLEREEAPKYEPEYVISEVSDVQIEETVIEIPEVCEAVPEASSAEVTSFLFGFGTPNSQKKGSTGFRFVFGSNDDADFDDEEIVSVASDDAAITASSLSGNPIGL